MIRGVRHVLSVLLAFVVLGTSNGVVFAVHTCLKEAVTEVSIFQNDDCCEEKPVKSCCSKPVAKNTKKDCCTISVGYSKLEVVSPATAKQLCSIATPCILVAGFEPLRSEFNSNSATVREPWPPPLNSASHSDFIFTSHSLLI